MRIMHVMVGEEHGGAESHFINVVEALHKAGIEQRVIIQERLGRADVLTKAGVSVRELPLSDFTEKRATSILKKEADAFKPDIVQTWMYQATRAMPSGKFIHIGWLRGYEHLKEYRNCDYLVGMTKGIVSSIIEQKWPADRIYHIRPFAEVLDTPPTPRSDYSTPEDAPLIVSLGRLHWHKAYDSMIMALPHIPNAYWWIAGDGELKDELQKFAEDIGVIDRIRFLGWQANSAALYKAADVIVLPSRYEPFGLVMAEAWAHKKPLVATKAAGPRATAQHEVDALLVAIDDVDGLSASIKRILNDAPLREKLVKQGYAHYLQDYTLQATVAQYRQLYNEVLSLGQATKQGASSGFGTTLKRLFGGGE